MSEIKFNIEDMTRCPGACEGCLLTARERSGAEGSSVLPWLDLARFCAEHVARLDPTGDARVAVNLGQGDHLLLTEAELRQRLDWVRTVFFGRAELFMTVSAIAKPEVFERQARTLARLAKEMGQRVDIDMVFDPAITEMAGFWPRYGRNIEVLFDLFERTDLNLNIGVDTVRACTAEQFHEFVVGNGFRGLTINYVPTTRTAQVMADAGLAMFDWLARLRARWESSGRPYNLTYARAMERLAADSGSMELAQMLQQCEQALARELYIDHAGELAFTQAMVGDYPLGDRTGWPSIGNVTSTGSQQVLAAAKRVAGRLFAQASARRSCAECEHLKGCYLGGMVAAAGVTRGEGDCPTGVRRLWRAMRPAEGEIYRVPNDVGRRAKSGKIFWISREGA